MKESFSKNDSNVIKGVAIIMMMWHHCFLSGRSDSYIISFWPFFKEQVVAMAGFFKICVSLFAFVSGYGLYQSFNKNYSNKKIVGGYEFSKWILFRYVRSFSGYWFIVFIS